MEYIKEYSRALKGTNFVIKLRDQIGFLGPEEKFEEDIKYIEIIDDYENNYVEAYQLIIQINDTRKTILIYEDIVVDVYCRYKINEEKYSLIKNIISKTIELSKKHGIKKILIPDDLHGLNMSTNGCEKNKIPNTTYLKEIGFRYKHDIHIEGKKTKSINLKIIQIAIIKNTPIDFRSDKLNEEKDTILSILQEVKLIYKRNSKLVDFRKEMTETGYWKIIEKEIYKILGLGRFDVNQPSKFGILNTMELNL